MRSIGGVNTVDKLKRVLLMICPGYSVLQVGQRTREEYYSSW